MAIPQNEDTTAAEETQLTLRPSPWRSIAGLLVMLGGAVFLGRALLKSSEDLKDLSFHFSAPQMVVSMAALVTCLAISPIMWKRILVDFRHRLSFRNAFAVYFVSALTKYLPGSVWAYVGMAHYGRRFDLSARTTLFTILLQQAVICGGSILIFGATLLLWPGGGIEYPLVAVASWLLAGVILLSPLPKRVLGFLADRIYHEDTAPPRFTRRALIVSLGYFLLSCIPFAIGYYYLLQAFYPSTLRDVVIFTGIYTISWLIGFVAIVSPSGLGIRDGVQAYLLSFFVPSSVAVTIALVQRVWLTVADLITGVISLWLLKRVR